MRTFIVFFAEGSEQDPDYGRITITASGKLEAERIFKETYANRRIEGILTASQYERFI